MSDTKTTGEPETADSKSLQLELMIGGETDAGAMITLTDQGVELDESMTEDQWKSGLRMFKWAKSRLDMGLAGYISFGRLKFGKEVVDACLTQLEFDMPTVQRAIDISTIPEDIRHDNLDSSHYVVLARSDLTKPQRAKWAKTASEQSLSASVLKASIAAGHVVPASVAAAHNTGVLTIQGVVQEFEIWIKRVGGIEGIIKQAPEDRQAVVDYLDRIASFRALLCSKLANLPREGKPKKKPAAKKPSKKAPTKKKAAK